MNRKNFIRTTGIGLGIALFPSLLKSASLTKSIESVKTLNPKIIKNGKGAVLNVIGDIQMHKISGEDTDNQVAEWVNDVAPGVGIPPHVHTKEDEIFRVLKGKVEIMVGDTTTVLEPGDIAFAPKNVPHAWKVLGTENASMCTTAFPAGIEKMFAELNKLPPGPPDFEKVETICGAYGINFIKQ